MDLPAIDRNLARLREMVAAMSTNLVDLESDSGRTRLDGTPLAGSTAARWIDARAALACLWQWFSQLNDVLEKATQLRGTKYRLDRESLGQLDWLVNGPSIELSTAGIPLAERGLFGPAQTTVRCSPPELLDRMRAAFDQVVALIGECSRRWSTIDGTLRPLEAQLAEAGRIADAIGEAKRPELEGIRAQVDQFRQSVMCDPLASPAVSVDTIAASLASVADELRRLQQLRDSLAARLAEARTLIDDLQAVTTAAGEARDEALAKIVGAAVIDPLPVATTLKAELDRAAAMSAQGDWRAAGNHVVQLTTRWRDALADAERALAANRAPVATRGELRGRLDAYRAKAYRLGLLETPAVAGLYARAKEALYTAPTDLVTAERLVRQYQEALTGPAPQEVAT